MTLNEKFEPWPKKYEEVLGQYKEAKLSTIDLKTLLLDKQERYITREQEYRDVIDEIKKKITDNSTMPLDIIEEKTEDQYLLEGIDIHDPEHSK